MEFQDSVAPEAQVKALKKEGTEEVAKLKEAIEATSKDKTEALEKFEALEDLVRSVFDLAEKNEFSYLNLALVPNTKAALRLIYGQKGHTIEKDYFVRVYALPYVVEVEDLLTEKHAILNALLTSGLLAEQGSLLVVTDKGERFLKFMGAA